MLRATLNTAKKVDMDNTLKNYYQLVKTFNFAIKLERLIIAE